MSQSLYRVVAGVVRQADQVLLIHQRGLADALSAWTIPGGAVEDGELLTEALGREMLEETGLQVGRLGRLAYTIQVDNRLEGDQLLAFVFEVRQWEGTLQPNDPDEHILDAKFWLLSDALRLLQNHPWSPMRDPLLAYLRGDVVPGSVWLYRHYPSGELQQLEIIAGG